MKCSEYSEVYFVHQSSTRASVSPLASADDGDGVLNAKLADFGLHAIVEAAERNETVQRMCASSLSAMLSDSTLLLRCISFPLPLHVQERTLEGCACTHLHDIVS